jgi:hypothetical protein
VANTAGIPIIPGNIALGKLYDEYKAGRIPWINSFEAFFSDDVHLNNLGNYYIALVHYATVYKTSPVGTSIPG